MAQPKRTFIDGTFGQIHTRVSLPEKHDHPPLLCLHMSPKSGRSFERFMHLASNDRIVVAPDYPGYGESSKPPPDYKISVQEYASSAWEVVDSLCLLEGNTKIDLLGHHTGSIVAAEMTNQRPNHVHNIVIISAPVLNTKEIDAFHSAFAPIPLDEKGSRFHKMWERIVRHRGPGMTLEMMAESLAENLRGGEAYEEGHRAAFEYSPLFLGIVKTLSNQIVIPNPKDDLYDYTHRLAKYLQNGTIIDKPSWGHGFLDTYTDDAVKSVKKALL